MRQCPKCKGKSVIHTVYVIDLEDISKVDPFKGEFKCLDCNHEWRKDDEEPNLFNQEVCANHERDQDA